MANPRQFDLEDILIRPGTYFNPQTEVLVVIDDSPDLDTAIFNMEDFEGADWVLISDEVPIDGDARDELMQAFQVRHGSTLGGRHPHRRRGRRRGRERRARGRRAPRRVAPAPTGRPGDGWHRFPAVRGSGAIRQPVFAVSRAGRPTNAPKRSAAARSARVLLGAQPRLERRLHDHLAAAQHAPPRADGLAVDDDRALQQVGRHRAARVHVAQVAVGDGHLVVHPEQKRAAGHRRRRPIRRPDPRPAVVVLARRQPIAGRRDPGLAVGDRSAPTTRRSRAASPGRGSRSSAAPSAATSVGARALRCRRHALVERQVRVLLGASRPARDQRSELGVQRAGAASRCPAVSTPRPAAPPRAACACAARRRRASARTTSARARVAASSPSWR